MNIYILRHARTKDNDLDIMGGQTDTPLSEKGQEEAENLIPLLKKYKFDVCIVSSLNRTMQTINPYLKTLRVKPIIEINDLIIERSLGSLTNTSKETLNKHKEKSNQDLTLWTPPEGESIADVMNRVRIFFLDIKQMHKNESVLICGHKNSLRCIELLIKKMEINDYFSEDLPQLNNSELRKYVI